jgi:hypothetical protein
MGYDIANWRITRVGAGIDTGGGELTSYDGNTTVQIPAGGITSTVIITHQAAYGMPPGSGMTTMGQIFDLIALYENSGQPAQPVQPYTITIQYDDTEVGPAIEDTLRLYWWNDAAGQWSQQGISSSVDISGNEIVAEVEHFSRFAVLGETNQVYLPVTLR